MVAVAAILTLWLQLFDEDSIFLRINATGRQNFVLHLFCVHTRYLWGCLSLLQQLSPAYLLCLHGAIASTSMVRSEGDTARTRPSPVSLPVWMRG